MYLKNDLQKVTQEVIENLNEHVSIKLRQQLQNFPQRKQQAEITIISTVYPWFKYFLSYTNSSREYKEGSGCLSKYIFLFFTGKKLDYMSQLPIPLGEAIWLSSSQRNLSGSGVTKTSQAPFSMFFLVLNLTGIEMIPRKLWMPSWIITGI